MDDEEDIIENEYLDLNIPQVGPSDADQNVSLDVNQVAEESHHPEESSLNQTMNNQQSDAEPVSLHSYLGQELEQVRGRTVLDEGSVVTLDLLQCDSTPVDIVLMPGQILPLTVFDPPTINMLRNCIRNDRTFGVLATWSEPRGTKISNIGTTAEIYEYLPEDGSEGFRIKAKARQRFKLVDSKKMSGSRWQARVRILPEVCLPDALAAVKIHSLNKHRTSTSNRQRFKKVDAAVTSWPAFVYDQYDLNMLVKNVKKELNNNLLQGPKKKAKESAVKVTVPEDPTELSFWVAQNLPMKEHYRLLLLTINSPIQRLRWELGALRQWKPVLCCQYCRTVVGSSGDMFCMSTEGTQSTYVNPGGYLHETLTLYKVHNIFSIGPPSTQFSWFPGYAWSISKCKQCGQHMGWEFKATNSKLKPGKFWGICRRSITIKVLQVRDDGSTIEKDEDVSHQLVC